MAREHLLKVGVSGVRGVIGGFLTPALGASYAQAFGTYVGKGRVVIGRDTRTSGEMLTHAVNCGLLAAGCEVIDLGVIPTPTIQIYIAHTRARGGIALTASHNPPEYNALKLFNREGLFFNHYERTELLDLFHQSDFARAGNDEIRGVRQDLTTAPALHLARVLCRVDADAIRRRRFRVALDGVNGAGSELSIHFLQNVLQTKLEAISVDPTKVFPRIAEPRPDTLTELAELVRRSGSDVGFGQDPDGDRLAVCDETGQVLDNDDVLALAVHRALAYTPGDVVVNLTTSSAIDDIATAHGRRVYRTPVGEANVVEMMQAVGAAIGGEGSSGGIIYPAVHLCRDSYTAMALVLDLMAETGKTVSELVAELPRYTRLSGKVPFEHGRLGTLMQSLEEGFPDAETNRMDGLKLSWGDRWLHVRSSNTEPLLRLAVEARTAEAAQTLFDNTWRQLTS